MRMVLKRILCLVLTTAIVTTTSGCSQNNSGSSIEQTSVEDLQFTGLNDERLEQYTQDVLLANLEDEFRSDNYRVEDIHTRYVSKEYLEELAFNSQKNIYFGYSLADIEEQLGGQRYVFTLGYNGKTIIEARDFEGYDDTFNRVATNVAIGGGVILVCVTVTVATGGAGAPAAIQTVNAIFAASAKNATTFALKSAVMGGLTSAIVTGYETGDLESALKNGVLGASQGFAIGAITGAITGAASKAIKLKNTRTGVRSFKESEIRAKEIYNGKESVAYKDGEIVNSNTKGCSIPDVLRDVDGHLEAIEVKNYDLNHYYSKMKSVLKEQILQRVKNLPPGSTQRVCLDVKNRQYDQQFLDKIVKDLSETLTEIDPSVVIDLMH